ncbi:50S ribosomal protein L5 [Candidatus Methanoperedenaceae archaeon GB37]|nr:50S ribosomal protein L5 [Candidatus Methanoperedenaceae archaeon GB37]
MSNPMLRPRIEKVTVHIGVGESGERLASAEKIMKTITGRTPVRTKAKKTLPGFGIKKREPIGCKTTLRGKTAEEFLKTCLKINEDRLAVSQFDDNGNFAFGIEEHTDFPGMKYDPEIGIFGMDVIVSVKKPGYRVRRRRVQRSKVPTRHKLTPEDSIAYMKEEFNIEVIQDSQ